MLWLTHTGVLAGEELDIWTPLNATTNKPDCQHALALTLTANSTAEKPGDAVTLKGSNITDITTATGPQTLLYVCLPDTVDPRGPKGK